MWNSIYARSNKVVFDQKDVQDPFRLDGKVEATVNNGRLGRVLINSGLDVRFGG
jgi:hypothetical protein